MKVSSTSVERKVSPKKDTLVKQDSEPVSQHLRSKDVVMSEPMASQDLGFIEEVKD